MNKSAPQSPREEHLADVWLARGYVIGVLWTLSLTFAVYMIYLHITTAPAIHCLGVV